MSYYVGSSLVEELFNMVLVLPKWVTPHTLASPPNSGQRLLTKDVLLSRLLMTAPPRHNHNPDDDK